MQAAKQAPNACRRRVQSLPLSTIRVVASPAGSAATRPRIVGVSAIVMHEMWVGAYKSQRREHNLGVVDNQREFVRVTGLTTVDWAT